MPASRKALRIPKLKSLARRSARRLPHADRTDSTSSSKTEMRRREFVRGCLGTAAFAIVGGDALLRSRPAIASGPGPKPSASGASVELTLRAQPQSVSLLEGRPTDVWRFSANLARGPKDTLVASDKGYLGPTLRLRRGQRVRVDFENGIGEQSIVHWHGLQVAQRNDGHPSSAVASGERYAYDFEVNNRAGTYWYHAHPADRTGPQVYRGLAGLLLVTDDDEQRLGLPDGDRELTLVLQDRSFDADNQLLYSYNSMVGFLGDRVLVNGRLPETREVRRGAHRLRVLNGSNSRIYDLGWSDGSPLIVLGTDGGLIDAPQARSHVVLAPGQRLDVWASFGDKPGEDVWLESRAFDGVGPTMGMGMGGGMMGRGMGGGMMGRGMGGGMMGGGAATVANGAPLRIQRFVTTGSGSAAAPPDRLIPAPGPTASEVTNARSPKTFTTTMRMMRFLLNGRQFEMSDVTRDERVRRDTVEEWEFVNPGGGMSMAHPIHIHGSQFHVVARKAGAGASALHEGVFDEGWQDTFLLLPGDRVRLRIRFGSIPVYISTTAITSSTKTWG